MSAPQRVVQAVQAAIVASAHLAAYEHVAAAAQACSRLGGLTSGRWRAAARELAHLEAVTSRADELGVPDDALWTVGDAAATLDLLREAALDELEEGDTRGAALLQGSVLFGVSFVEDPELPDRGTTLLFGWPEPLTPASWPWQANWVVGNGQDKDNGEEAGSEELDLFESGEIEGEEPHLAELADELGCSRQDARATLRAVATALTRASLLASTGGEDEDDESDDEEDNGTT
jgi:hypothetical protein